jgi:hypothetical protein
MATLVVGKGIGVAAAHACHQGVGGTQVYTRRQAMLMGRLCLTRFRYLK